MPLFKERRVLIYTKMLYDVFSNAAKSFVFLNCKQIKVLSYLDSKLRRWLPCMNVTEVLFKMAKRTLPVNPAGIVLLLLLLIFCRHWIVAVFSLSGENKRPNVFPNKAFKYWPSCRERKSTVDPESVSERVMEDDVGHWKSGISAVFMVLLQHETLHYFTHWIWKQRFYTVVEILFTSL